MRKLALLAGLLPFLNVFGQGYKVYQSDGKVDAYPGETAVSVTLNDDPLHYNGHEYVDLGLPSGTRWALTNVGADKSHSNGLHFHFAQVGIETLWGGDWCLPSIGQYQELINVCQWEWATVAGSQGYKVTGPNGNTLFLPAAGMKDASGSFANLLYGQKAGYWTREGYCFAFTSEQKGIDSHTPAIQLSLRPVIGGTDPQDKRSEVLKDDVHECVDLGLSVLWATTNIGADTPEANGDYFGPGFTEPRPQAFDWNNTDYHRWYTSQSPYYTDENMQIAGYMYQYYTLQGREAEFQEWGEQTTLLQRKGINVMGRWLLPEHDAATALWGDGWRMPTMAEYRELLEKTRRTGSGSILTLQGPTGNTITLPRAGYYPQSSTNPTPSSSYMYLTSSITEGYPCLVDVAMSRFQYDSYSASNGFYPIRPVKDRPKSGLTDEATKAGQEMVDLGLSVMWANCNWGAATPKDKGEYIACGETSPKQMYTKDNYNPGEAYTAQGMQTMLGKAGWMLPSKANMEELIEKCTWAREEDGYRVTGPNGNSIFLPYTGFREGASLCFPDELGFYRTSDVESGMALNIGNKGDNDFSAIAPTPYYGMAVRPVMNPLQPVTGEAVLTPGNWFDAWIPFKTKGGYQWSGIQFCYMKYMDEKESGAWNVSSQSYSPDSDNYVITNLQPGTTYYYRAYATYGDTLTLYGDIKQLHTSDYVLAIDLGLSVKWAPFNLGGDNEYDLADWFLHPTSYGLDASQLPSTSYGFQNGSYLPPQTGWSDEWRMPTEAEFQELVDKCTWEWQEGNKIVYWWETNEGVKTYKNSGYRVTGPNGNSIFLPAHGMGTMGEPIGLSTTGLYWTQTPNEKPAGTYKFFKFTETDRKFSYGPSEFRSIRPVKK